MLVLTRKQNEKIQIGDNVTITVVRMKGKTVRLGIQAPSDMSVLRGELVFDLDDADGQPAEQTETAAASTARPRDKQENPNNTWEAARAAAKPAPVADCSSDHWAPLQSFVASACR